MKRKLILNKKQLKEFAELNFEAGKEKAHMEELRILRIIQKADIMFHGDKNCDCIICERIRELEK